MEWVELNGVRSSMRLHESRTFCGTCALRSLAFLERARMREIQRSLTSVSWCT